MNGRAAVLSVMLLGAVLAAGCGPTAAITSSTTAPATTAPSTTSPVTTATGPLSSTDVAVAFFEAWRSQDRGVMEQLAEPAALAEAHALADLAAEDWEPEMCEGAAGTVHCIWTSEAGTLAIGVGNIQEPHLVTSFGLVLDSPD